MLGIHFLKINKCEINHESKPKHEGNVYNFIFFYYNFYENVLHFERKKNLLFLAHIVIKHKKFCIYFGSFIG